MENFDEFHNVNAHIYRLKRLMGRHSTGAYNDNAQRFNVVWLRKLLLQVSISVTIIQGANEINS